MSFPDYEALRFESQPTIPGAATRLMLLRRGAGVERERIIGLLEAERNEADDVVDLEFDLEPQLAYHESQMLTYLIAKIKGETND